VRSRFRVRRTKVLATVGPAVDREDRLEALLRAGVDAFRLNFSHGTDDAHRATLRRIHSVERRARREVAIVADVQGPKVRIGDLAHGSVRLAVGQPWRLDRDAAAGDVARVGAEIPSFHRAAHRGDPVLLGDGNVELVVESVRPDAIETRVVRGGVVTSHAGLFLPRAHLRTDVLGPKDRADAALALAGGVDFLALSFVRDRADVLEGRRWLDRRPGGGSVGIIAKIERAEALAHIDGILELADGIMVARGDLGIEVPLERLALEQKQLIRRANVAGKFVIVATQMLLSMLSAPRPTRAEATDVANAVLDGTDAVMLSEESAVGTYPVESVEWLVRIAEATEPAFDPRPVRELRQKLAPPESDRSVAAAAVQLAEGVGARALVTPTHSGRTARLVAALRPQTPVVALTRSAATRRRLALVRGVTAVASPEHRDLVDMSRRASRLVLDLQIPGRGPIVLTAGYPLRGRPTNLVTVLDPEATLRDS
jgi:pyruvate kinase